MPVASSGVLSFFFPRSVATESPPPYGNDKNLSHILSVTPSTEHFPGRPNIAPAADNSPCPNGLRLEEALRLIREDGFSIEEAINYLGLPEGIRPALQERLKAEIMEEVLKKNIPLTISLGKRGIALIPEKSCLQWQEMKEGLNLFLKQEKLARRTPENIISLFKVFLNEDVNVLKKSDGKLYLVETWPFSQNAKEGVEITETLLRSRLTFDCLRREIESELIPRILQDITDKGKTVNEAMEAYRCELDSTRLEIERRLIPVYTRRVNEGISGTEAMKQLGIVDHEALSLSQKGAGSEISRFRNSVYVKYLTTKIERKMQ